MIHTVETIHQAPDRQPAERVPALWARRMFGVEWEAPKGHAAGVTVYARVNDGRWIADCATPGCNGAELVSPADPRLFCCSCQNVAQAGRWVTVEFPKDRSKIEAALAQRPLPQTRHWSPGETAAELQVENRMAGVR